MRAHSDSDGAAFIEVSGGREIVGISSNFFTNFEGSVVFFLGSPTRSCLKAFEGDRGADGEPWGEPRVSMFSRIRGKPDKI